MACAQTSRACVESMPPETPITTRCVPVNCRRFTRPCTWISYTSAQRLSRFEVIRQLRQDAAQLTAFGTHGNQAAIELGESPGKPRQRAGERFARRDLLAHRTQHAHRGGVIRLLGDCTQCLVERHPRCDQRRELTRRQREYRRREPRGIGPACE